MGRCRPPRAARLYNGIPSQATFDLTGAAVSVETIAPPSSDTRADMMLTLTVDNPHHYRFEVPGKGILDDVLGGTSSTRRLPRRSGQRGGALPVLIA